MRILNRETLLSHGNVQGRTAVLDILEAGLSAADPFGNTLKLIRVKGDQLYIGHPDMEPSDSPTSGELVLDLARVRRILVVGAGKGCHRVAEAIEHVLGERVTGGHVVVKHGDSVALRRVGFTFGGHPVPDEGCVRGCQAIVEVLRDLTPEDLVFTVAANGVSALLTLPVPGVSLEDVRRTTYLMQIERGTPTYELNAVRNHLDQLKGGRLSRLLQPAHAVHLLAVDPNGDTGGPDGYRRLIFENRWLHNLPESTTFADAVAVLKKWDAWDQVPASVRAHLVQADPSQETVKAPEFERTRFRIFGVMPHAHGMLPAAQRRAAELGYRPVLLSDWLQCEAKHAGTVIACIARTIERTGSPCQPPCALFSTGELLVTVGDEKGVGGRNQEYALAAALTLAGSRNTVMGAVDSDGTDGPGGQFRDGWTIPTLAGGIVDGDTAAEALAVGVDVHRALQTHDSTPALWALNSGILATHGISVVDLAVTLVSGRGEA